MIDIIGGRVICTMVAYVFCTRLGGTVGIVEPRGVVESGGGGTSGIDETRGGVLCISVSKLTWSRSRPVGRDQPIMPP